LFLAKIHGEDLAVVRGGESGDPALGCCLAGVSDGIESGMRG
jgi:hypothetical protein